MYIIKALLTIFILSITSCNFGDSDDSKSGGSLFAGHRPSDNEFSVKAPQERTYLLGEKIQIRLSHPANLNVTGTPRILLQVDGNPRYANYTTGNNSRNINFEYTVQAGDQDLQGIFINDQVDLNGGSITFNEGQSTKNATLNFPSIDGSKVKIDTIEAEITNIITPPPKTYLFSQEINFILSFSKAINVQATPRLALTIGSDNVYADYISGSGSNTLVFRRVVNASDIDNDGIELNSPIDLNSGSLKDSSGIDADLTFGAVSTSSILVNGIIPWAKDVSQPIPGTYRINDFVDITLGFTKNVNVSGSPRLAIEVGGSTRYANYLNGSGSSELTFRYLVSGGDLDLDGIEYLGVIDLNGGSIRDIDNNNAHPDFLAPYTPNVLVNGEQAMVTSITAPSNGTYRQGDTLNFVLNFNKTVTISGTPSLDFLIDSNAPSLSQATYISGSGTDSITMRYIVQSGEVDLSGITLVNPLSLNSGSIKDLQSVDANLDISDAIASTNTNNIFIDAEPPYVTSISPPSDGTYSYPDSLSFILNFNENVFVTGSNSSIDLDIGGNLVQATYVSGSGSNQLLYEYELLTSDIDNDGIEIT